MNQIKSTVVVASEDLTQAINDFKALKKQMKVMEVQEKKIRDRICEYMGDCERLVDSDGVVAVTWAKINDSFRLDADTLKLMYPEAYKDCLTAVPGSRRFVVK